MTRVIMRRRGAMAALAIGFAGLTVASPSSGRAASAGAPPAVVHDEGSWDLVFERGNRRCRLFLRGDVHGAGHALGMPPGCHHAFPRLALATNWSAGSDERVAFHTDAGATVIDFEPNGTAALSGAVGEGDVYTLMPANPATQDAIRQVAVGATPVVAAASPASAQGVMVERSAKAKGLPRAEPVPVAPVLPPVTAAEVAGNYAVLRKTRDTGCMVTLEPSARARLAPACRDQGIVIFDPAHWQLTKGELVLTAKRGHSTALKHLDAKTWGNAPTSGTALVLKRL